MSIPEQQDEIERELSYLAATVPKGLEEHPHIKIEDIYFSAPGASIKTRIRRKGNEFVFTKKVPLAANDASQQREHTIMLSADEYDALSRGNGRKVSKVRYFLPYKNYVAEVDIFTWPLKGLVVIEFEFLTSAEKDRFEMPAFCLADVTQEDFIAGGSLAGKTYQDIASDLERFGYQALISSSSRAL